MGQRSNGALGQRGNRYGGVVGQRNDVVVGQRSSRDCDVVGQRVTEMVMCWVKETNGNVETNKLR